MHAVNHRATAAFSARRVDHGSVGMCYFRKDGREQIGPAKEVDIGRPLQLLAIKSVEVFLFVRASADRETSSRQVGKSFEHEVESLVNHAVAADPEKALFGALEVPCVRPHEFIS